MTHPFDRLTLDNGAAFLFTPCPGTKTEDLPTSLATLKSAGATAVVTALPVSEMKHLAVEMLGGSVVSEGMAWFHLPIEDDCAPGQDFFTAFEWAQPALLKKMAAGETIVIHCRGGSGRTGLIAAILMMASGMEKHRVVSLVQSIRPTALTIPAHREFLTSHYGL